MDMLHANPENPTGSSSQSGAIRQLKLSQEEESQTLAECNKELQTQLELIRHELLVNEQAMSLQADRFYDFIMKAPAGICVLAGPDMVFETINPFYQQLFPGRKLLGLPIREALPEVAISQLQPILTSVYQTGFAYEGKELLVPIASYPGGPLHPRFFNFIYQARYDSQNEVNGILVFVSDVTQYVEARRGWKLSESNSREMLNAIPQITFTMDVEGSLIFVNQHWCDYTGLDFERDRHNVWALTTHPDEFDGLVSMVGTLLSGTAAGEFEMRKKRKDGNYLWHICNMHPILNEDGIVSFWIGTATNIDELKKVQQQKDDFINIASHELKTPLTTLKVAIQLINERNEGLSETMFNKLMCKATTSLDTVINLVDDLLNVGKFSQGQLVLKPTCFVLSSLVMDYCQDINIAGKYRVILEGDLELHVLADAQRIEQVLVNILNNAMKYSPEFTEIRIHIKKDGTEAKVSVTDNGPGIHPEILPRLFDRYFRVEKDNYQTTGLGLGLYICAEIISKHGGEINVRSECGEGSTFWFTLPLFKPIEGKA